ncbi:MAG: YbbC/YhhH family protein [Pseudomonadota bacterium]|nr:YbbC/YhhH family protein [Pseudomonadota bacterium]
MKENASLPGYQPKEGLVPDAKTAIIIALAVWEPVYGKANVASEGPYGAVLRGSHWTVSGTLRKGSSGGVATAVIDKKNGRIIKIYHTK